MRTQRVGHRSASAGDETITEINVTPLVDVVLVLLVVLMVAAGVIAQRSLPIVLPAEGPPDASPPPRIEILLDAGGHASVAGAPVTDADLRARVRQMVATSPEGTVQASISADGRATHGDVVRVLDLLRVEHVHHIGIGVLPEGD